MQNSKPTLFILLLLLVLLLFGCSQNSTEKCGNGKCDGNENFATCSKDCNSINVPNALCGDGVCDALEKANSKLCPSDCTAKPNSLCGDGGCDTNEKVNPNLCPKDCSVSNVTVYKDLAYGTESSLQKLDLYLPTNVTGKIPLIIEIHGGGFSGGDKNNPVLSYYRNTFPKYGYAVAEVNYRLSGEAKYPAANYDVKSAVRWLRANATKYNLDPDNIGAIGGSSGGYFVSFLGTTGDTKIWDVGNNLDYSSSVKAVVDQFGPVDLTKLNLNYWLCSNPSIDCGNSFEASPINYISSNDSPFLILHGENDPQIPISQSQEIYVALQNAGVEVEFITVSNAGHGGQEFNEPYLSKYLEFFNKHLKN